MIFILYLAKEFDEPYVNTKIQIRQEIFAKRFSIHTVRTNA